MRRSFVAAYILTLAKAQNFSYNNAGAAARPSRHLLRLARRIGLSPGRKILDVACGVGDWLAVASERGASVSGIDISERAIEVCRNQMPRGEFHVGPAETLPFPDGYFDFVTCLGSLEHFLDQPKALQEMARVCKPNGKLLLLVPNAGFLTYRIGLYKGTQQQAARETIRGLAEWATMFQDAGLDVTKRWKDLHLLEWKWIIRPPWYMALPRLLQGLALLTWPIRWQYQVYHLCTLAAKSSTER